MVKKVLIGSFFLIVFLRRLYEKENKLSLPRGKKTEGLSLSERWTRWQFNRFFAKNYPNAKEMMAL